MQQDENISLFVMEFSRLGLISLFTIISDLLLLRLYSSRRDGRKYGIAVGVMFFASLIVIFIPMFALGAEILKLSQLYKAKELSD